MSDQQNLTYDNQGIGTRAIHCGQDPWQWKHGAVVPPISLSTTFAQKGPAELSSSGFDYSRSGNPTRKVFEECVAGVEGAKYCLAFASGLASTTTLLHILNEEEEVSSLFSFSFVIVLEHNRRKLILN